MQKYENSIVGVDSGVLDQTILRASIVTFCYLNSKQRKKGKTGDVATGLGLTKPLPLEENIEKSSLI